MPIKIGPYLDKMKTEFLDRDCENMFILKNGLSSPNLPLGNSLLFLTVPRSVVTRSTGIQIRDYYRTEEQGRWTTCLASICETTFLTPAGSGIGEMMATPNVFCVNNYGDVSARDGSEIHASQGTLTKYQWHMPIIVLGLAASERAGLSFTITIRDKAFNFETARASHQDDIGKGAIKTAGQSPSHESPAYRWYGQKRRIGADEQAGGRACGSAGRECLRPPRG